MRAWVLNELGGPASYELEDVKDPVPGPGDVRVRLRAAGLNHLDLWVARGKPAPSLPHVAGADGAGVVDAAGDGADVMPGAEVVVNPAVTCGRCRECTGPDNALCRTFAVVGEHRWGTLAEAVVVPAANAVPKPPGLSWEQAGAFGAVVSTAVRMLERARLARGEVLLVSGFGGGVGTAGVLVGAAMGADVYATVRDPARAARARELGARAVFDSGGPFARELREATGGRGADVVFEHLGRAVWDECVAALARGGRLVTTGATTGQEVSLSIPALFWRHQEISGSTLANHRQFARAASLVASGDVPVLVDEVFAFEEVPAALQRLEEGGLIGKLAVRI